MAGATQTSLRSDLAAAYTAAGAKVLAWAAVSRLVLGGGLHEVEFGLLTLIRSTLGMLNYTSLGLAPAMIHFLSVARSSGQDAQGQQARRLYANGLLLATALGAAATVVVAGYAGLFGVICRVPAELTQAGALAALTVGLGMVFRLTSDASSAYLQTSGRFVADNLLLVATEVAWIAITLGLMRVMNSPLAAAGAAFATASLGLLGARRWLAGHESGLRVARWSLFEKRLAIGMLSFGVMVTVSQLADFLYAPTDSILINWFLTPLDQAAYGVAVQVDAGLLLVSTAASAAVLPRAAMMLSRGDRAAVMRLYVLGTALTAVLLLAAALGVWWFCPVLLQVWLKADIPLARQILPWVLIHTIIGGCSGVGRAILIAAGKVGAFSMATILSGLFNVAVSFVLVRYTSLGLYGIIAGTIAAVAVRCLVWMPWYICRTLRQTQHLAVAAADV